MADMAGAWITIYPTIARDSQVDLTYEDVARWLSGHFDIVPEESSEDGRAHTWTFTPRSGGMGESEN